MYRPNFSRPITWLVALAVLFIATSGVAIAQGKTMPVRNDAKLTDVPPNVVSTQGATPAQAGSPMGQTEKSPVSPSASYTVTLGAWRNLRPTESYLRGVSMLPASYSVNCTDPDQKSKGWIVGDGGVILNYCNGVWDHAIIVESVPTNLWGVQAISPTLAVAVGEQGTVLMYLWDRIAQDWVWTKSPIPVGNEILYSVSMVPDGTGKYVGWAVGSQGTLVRGTITPATNTYTWENVTANYPSLPQVDYYFHVQMLSSTNGWAFGGTDNPANGVILHWDGVTWYVFQQLPTKALLGAYMISPTEGWVVGHDGVIYRFNGSVWSQVPSPTTDILVDIAFEPSGDGWAVGLGGVLVKYSHSENKWSLFTDYRTDPFDFRGLDFTSGHGWLVGFHQDKGIGGQILEYQDGLWLAVTPPTDNRLNALSNVSDNNAWAVGAADSLGGTVIHWDGKHWQRWYQNDLPLPKVDLYTIDMISANDGWAAGDPPTYGAPAVFLHWDGHRWAQPRYQAPVNVRVNSLDMLDHDFGWAVADTGDAVAKYDRLTADYWSANHTCQGIYYQLRGTSIVTATNLFGWDAWAVGSALSPIQGEYFMRYMSGCATSYAWDIYQGAAPCPGSTGGATTLQGIRMRPEAWGFATGDYNSRASIYYYSNGTWATVACEPAGSPYNPSRLYSVDIVKTSGVAWFGGYYTDPTLHKKVAKINYKDAVGWGAVGAIFPVNGRNIYDRPIASLKMSSDTMGWAVGDGVDARKLSDIFQYPYPNFTLDSSPPARAVIPGDSTFYTIAVNSLGGFSADVSLSLYSLPPGVTYDISPVTINAETISTIYITTSMSTPLGVYDIPLLGAATFLSGDNIFPVQRVSYLRLTVTNHPVYLVDPSHGPAGTLVTLWGTNFGSDPGVGNHSTITNNVVLAGQQMPDANVLSWSNDQITVQVPDNATLFPQGPTVGSVSVTANNYPSNADLSFQLENHITSVSTQLGSSVITATIVGTGLGTDPGTLYRSTYYEHVSLNGDWIPNASVKSWSYNVITFMVPMTTPSGLLSVTSNGFESNSLTFSPGFKVYLPVVLKP